MLAGAVRGLAGQGWQVSLLARRASRFAADGLPITPYDCDYEDSRQFAAALEQARLAHGPIRLSVAWFRTLKVEAPRLLAEAVGEAGLAGDLYLVLGSAVADPQRPDRLVTARAIGVGLPECRLHPVILGFETGQGRGRWLEHAEISSATLMAVATGAALTVIGRTRPWSLRPPGGVRASG